MSILHRIFVSKHKHKKIYSKRKTAYKKFIGLKTFKNVVYTKLCLPFQPEVFKTDAMKKADARKRAALKRKKAIKRRPHIRFRVLKFLTPHTRRQEVISAHRDIENFKNIAAETPEETRPEEKFQAFLPYSVWTKMSYEERGDHIRKRRAMALRDKLRRLRAPKYAFSNSRSRPVLRLIHPADRKRYLKRLIKFATAEPYHTITPRNNRDITYLELKNIKSTVRASKKARAKRGVYKNLTYASLLPAGTGLLID